MVGKKRLGLGDSGVCQPDGVSVLDGSGHNFDQVNALI
jgi:hypothetical protein